MPNSIGPQYFEKPYVPGAGEERPRKATCCCARRWEKTGKIGKIARVVIRTRESLCAVMPQGDALMLLN